MSTGASPNAALYLTDEGARATVNCMAEGWSSTVPISLTNARLTEYGFNIAKGCAGLQNGHFENAAAAFEQAVLAGPQAALPRYGLALAKRELGLNDQAIVALSHALRLNPGFAAARATLDMMLAPAPADEAPIHDTYSFMLDHPDQQSFAILKERIQYLSPDFSEEFYQQSRGETFRSRAAAYRDWVGFGRRNGLAYAPGKDTLLKIILKAKDEPDLIVKWIEHHAAIVGYHNLIIIDCGSKDEEYLNLLRGYRGKLLILDYEKYYDDIHWAQANRDFYEMLAQNCKYITVLDADEFVFGYLDDTISGGNVLRLLSRQEQNIYAGTWFSNCAPLRMTANAIDWTQEIKFSLEARHMKNGTSAGKSMMLSALAFQARHIGHNLHVKEVIGLLTPASFGKIFILHLSDLGPEINKSRVLKHLYAKGAIPPELPEDQIEAFLDSVVKDKSAAGMILHYIEKYRGKTPSNPEATTYFTTKMLFDNRTETSPAFFEAVDRFDFNAMLDSARKA